MATPLRMGINRDFAVTKMWVDSIISIIDVSSSNAFRNIQLELLNLGTLAHFLHGELVTSLLSMSLAAKIVQGDGKQASTTRLARRRLNLFHNFGKYHRGKGLPPRTRLIPPCAVLTAS